MGKLKYPPKADYINTLHNFLILFAWFALKLWFVLKIHHLINDYFKLRLYYSWIFSLYGKLFEQRTFRPFVLFVNMNAPSYI